MRRATPIVLAAILSVMSLSGCVRIWERNTAFGPRQFLTPEPTGSVDLVTLIEAEVRRKRSGGGESASGPAIHAVALRTGMPGTRAAVPPPTEAEIREFIAESLAAWRKAYSAEPVKRVSDARKAVEQANGKEIDAKVRLAGATAALTKATAAREAAEAAAERAKKALDETRKIAEDAERRGREARARYEASRGAEDVRVADGLAAQAMRSATTARTLLARLTAAPDTTLQVLELRRAVEHAAAAFEQVGVLVERVGSAALAARSDDAGAMADDLTHDVAQIAADLRRDGEQLRAVRTKIADPNGDKAGGAVDDVRKTVEAAVARNGDARALATRAAQVTMRTTAARHAADAATVAAAATRELQRATETHERASVIAETARRTELEARADREHASVLAELSAEQARKAVTHIDAERRWPDDEGRLSRNSIQDWILAASVDRCREYKDFLKRFDTETTFFGSALTTLLAGAGALVPPVLAAQALSGAAGVVSGWNADFGDKYFAQKTVQALTQAIEKRRSKIETDIKTVGQPKSVVDYSLEAAIKDALAYHAACSLTAALEEVAVSIDRAGNLGLEDLERLMKPNTLIGRVVVGQDHLIRETQRDLRDLRGETDRVAQLLDAANTLLSAVDSTTLDEATAQTVERARDVAQRADADLRKARETLEKAPTLVGDLAKAGALDSYYQVWASLSAQMSRVQPLRDHAQKLEAAIVDLRGLRTRRVVERPEINTTYRPGVSSTGFPGPRPGR